VLACAALPRAAAAQAERRGGDRSRGVLIGYWHNFLNGAANGLKLREIPAAYDVINVSFAEPTTPLGSTIQLVVDPRIYGDPQEFIDDVALLKSQGARVVISLGGANGPINLRSSRDVENFVRSMNDIIETFGFDGIDIDLEGSSLSLVPGDTDFRNPTSPLIVNFIDALAQVLDAQPSDFFLSMAPETFFVQVGMETYAGAAGAYLPVIHAFRDRLDSLHVQNYNTGSVRALDGVAYSAGTVEFLVGLAEMLLQGFPVAGSGAVFPPLRPDQVAIGLPASPAAAGSGFAPAGVVQAALRYLAGGERSASGQYDLIHDRGYPGLRGLMTFSINHDLQTGSFSRDHRPLLDILGMR
jgi:chitinase